MVLRLIADKRDELPEALRAGAVEKSGQFISELGDHSVEDATGLKEGLVSERAARKKVADMLKQFGWHLSEDGARWTSEGLDPKTVREAVETVKSGKFTRNDEIERWKQEIAGKFEDEHRAIQSKNKLLLERLREAKLEPIYSSIREQGGSVTLLAPAVQQRAQVTVDDETGVAKLVFLNDKGNPMLSRKSGSTDPMGPDEFVQDLRKHPEFRAAFAGTGPGGSGFSSQSGGSARVVKAGSDVSAMTPRELLERGRQYATPR